jgi:hypothetical protein
VEIIGTSLLTATGISIKKLRLELINELPSLIYNTISPRVEGVNTEQEEEYASNCSSWDLEVRCKSKIFFVVLACEDVALSVSVCASYCCGLMLYLLLIL